MKILIADDHKVVRDGLKRIIQTQPGTTLIGEAANGQEALDLVLADGWDLLLVDISMPQLNGIELLEKIRQHKSQVAVLILSVFPAEQLAFRMLKAGADGYLTKQTAAEELIPAIQTVCKGGKYVSPALTARFPATFKDFI